MSSEQKNIQKKIVEALYGKQKKKHCQGIFLKKGFFCYPKKITMDNSKKTPFLYQIKLLY